MQTTKSLYTSDKCTNCSLNLETLRSFGRSFPVRISSCVLYNTANSAQNNESLAST